MVDTNHTYFFLPRLPTKQQRQARSTTTTPSGSRDDTTAAADLRGFADYLDEPSRQSGGAVPLLGGTMRGFADALPDLKRLLDGAAAWWGSPSDLFEASSPGYWTPGMRLGQSTIVWHPQGVRATGVRRRHSARYTIQPDPHRESVWYNTSLNKLRVPKSDAALIPDQPSISHAEI